jgi:signal transduction histidine kinase
MIKRNLDSEFITASILKKKLNSLYSLQARNKEAKLNIRSSIKDNEKITTLSSGDLINIVGNLISNAIKFSSKKDLISVHIDYKGSGRDQYQITVADQGTGMTEKQIKDIQAFENHTSTEGTNNEQGFGIGLTEALRTLDNHGGTFNIDSSEDEGTTFTVFFPRKY